MLNGTENQRHNGTHFQNRNNQGVPGSKVTNSKIWSGHKPKGRQNEIMQVSMIRSVNSKFHCHFHRQKYKWPYKRIKKSRSGLDCERGKKIPPSLQKRWQRWKPVQTRHVLLHYCNKAWEQQHISWSSSEQGARGEGNEITNNPMYAVAIIYDNW